MVLFLAVRQDAMAYFARAFEVMILHKNHCILTGQKARRREVAMECLDVSIDEGLSHRMGVIKLGNRTHR